MARLLNLRYAAIRYYSGQYCPQYLLAGMVEYGVNFATFQPLDAEALDLLHDSLRGMWRTEEQERDVSEGELSASSSESSDEAMIPCTFSQSVLQQMRPGGGEVHGSSAGTENPLRSLLASFVSGQSKRLQMFVSLTFRGGSLYSVIKDVIFIVFLLKILPYS